MRNRLAVPLLCGIFIIYIAFLLLDALAVFPLASGILKYISICLCTVLAFLSISSNRCTLRAAFLLTLICDALLLFTSIQTPGILLFCGVHILSGVRLSRNTQRMAAVFAVVCVSLALLCLLPAVRARLSVRDRAGVLYAACLLLALGAAGHAALHTRSARAWRGFAGQAAFLLCDICVMLFNLLPSGPNALPGFLMWFFYLPAQTLLATSEDSFDMKRGP